MTDWRQISNITLFVEDLDAAKTFYREVFGLPIYFEDPHSAVFKFGDTLLNLLVESAVPELVSPAAFAPRTAGSRGVHSHSRRRRRDVWGADRERSSIAQRPDESALGYPNGQFPRSQRLYLGDRQVKAGRGPTRNSGVAAKRFSPRDPTRCDSSLAPLDAGRSQPTAPWLIATRFPTLAVQWPGSVLVASWEHTSLSVHEPEDV